MPLDYAAPRIISATALLDELLPCAAMLARAYAAAQSTARYARVDVAMMLRCRYTDVLYGTLCSK